MAKDKERQINPAQQQRKLEKAKALQKSKNEQQARRNEKLARRNPDRLQRQIDDLKALEASGEIKPREKTILADLERDLKAIHKARTALGDKAPQYGNRQPPRTEGGAGSILGKRQHNGERVPPRRRDENESETDEDVRRIPMPEDTPPPMPREHRRYFNQNQHKDGATTQPSIPAVEVKTTYSAAPQIRDLKKEATSKFVPDVVRRKHAAVSGQGGLLEPEELDRLEAQGYYGNRKAPEPEQKADEPMEDDTDARRLAEEEARFERELGMVDEQAAPTATTTRTTITNTANPPRRNVEIEEVEDEGA